MLPATALPFYDAEDRILPHLERLDLSLRGIFAQVYAGVPQTGRNACLPWIEKRSGDPFYRIVPISPDLPVGDQFLALYRFAVDGCPPDQVLHLCFPDRVIFATQEAWRATFAADVAAAGDAGAPLLYQRSAVAWEMHPNNYREMESFLTRVGESLLGRSLDFAWCHLAVRARRLGEILPQIQSHDLSILAEIVLLLKDEIRTQDVDWLAWEDPFLLGADPARLKAERERSQQEVRKRLSYVVPMLNRLRESS